jgi:glycosyltransferase involved in cell wall biosynthesis
VGDAPVSEAPKVSVVVPHYRDLTGLDLCLAALGRQTYPRDAIEIIVADNASPEGEAAVAQTIAGRAKLVVVTEKGAGPARNGGVAAATGEILAFTDCDCQPEAAWVAEGVRALAEADFVGGAMKVLVDDPARLTPAEAFERVFAFDNETYVNRKGFTVTANLFCPRALFDAVGGFRNGVSEDVEWSQRATAAGRRIGYAPLAVVGHPARRQWSELQAKWRRLNAETYKLQALRPAGRLRWLARALLLPASALVHTPRVLSSRDLDGADQRLAALGMLYRLRFWRFADALRLLGQAKEG